MRHHIVKPGESLLSIAKYYGFGSVEPIASHADNKDLIAERHGTLEIGDVLTIPGGRIGQSEHGTGRGHELTIRQIPSEFQVRLFTALHKQDLNDHGDKSRADDAGTWQPVFIGGTGTPIRQIRAKIDFSIVHGLHGVAPAGGWTDTKTGMFSTKKLVDGAYRISIHPEPAMLSKRPAGADPGGDHGRGFYKTESEHGSKDSDGNSVPSPAKPYPHSKNYELEYRPLEIIVEVQNYAIQTAWIASKPAPSRPHHAVLFWTGCEDSEGKQVLEVDWKPDFIRRIVGELRPRHRVRDAPIDVVMFHHTAGMSVGSALFTFTSKNITSGAHFVVDLDGHVIRMADDRYETKHGGGGRDVRTPAWRNQSSPGINTRSIGIEHVHKDLYEPSPLDFTEESPYTPGQYAASIDLIQGLIAAYHIPRNNVIGHQDAVAKAACPGWHVDWPRLEAAGVALAPAPLSSSEVHSMFGEFYSSPDRVLRFGCRDVEQPDGRFTVVDGADKVVAADLAGPPVAGLRNALRVVGYNVDMWIKVGSTKHQATEPSRFEETLGYALSQFIRHFCTERRLRPDLRMAYRDSPRVWNELFVDEKLATLLQGAAKAATGL